jgi:hypothetical protein
MKKWNDIVMESYNKSDLMKMTATQLKKIADEIGAVYSINPSKDTLLTQKTKLVDAILAK